MKSFVLLVMTLIFSILSGPAMAADAAAPVMDVVTLNDGSIIYGEVVEMDGGVLQIKNPSASDALKVKWSDVRTLTISHPVPFHLKEGTILTGTAEESEPGTLRLKAEPMQDSITVPMEAVASVNPIIQPPVIYTGTFTGGFSQNTGNTQLRNASVLGDFVARSELWRLTFNGRYVYGDSGNEVIARNSRATLKLDFFITKRFFWFASAYGENDSFQDLRLRTALSSGPGYQFIDRGDFNGLLKDMTVYAEAGLAYFSEDFVVGDSTRAVRGRWSLKWNWSLLEDRITFYHFDEFFPSLQDARDFYLTMDTGMRFRIWQNFVSGIQVTTRYNNSPPPGTGDTDHLYLFTVGYNFDTTKKR
jgi:putative salt-induced outer membrane protein YdiY